MYWTDVVYYSVVIVAISGIMVASAEILPLLPGWAQATVLGGLAATCFVIADKKTKVRN